MNTVMHIKSSNIREDELKKQVSCFETLFESTLDNLDEKEEQLKCFLKNIPMCAYMKDLHEKYIIGSYMFKNLVGEAEDTEDIDLSKIFTGKSLELELKENEEIVKTRKAITIERQIKLQNQTCWYRIRKSPVLDRNSKVKYIIVIYENIESEKELKRQKEYFMETLIHDLKIPTLAQLRALELLHNEALGKLEEAQKEMLSQIEQSCKYMLEMISMVLNTYRYENGEQAVWYEKFNLAELIQYCTDEIITVIDEKGLIVELDMPDDIKIEADRRKLKKVIMHLLSNAVLYSYKNEKIHIKTECDSDSVKFSIQSSGMTLSKRECLTMFDRCTEGTQRYTTVGNGIGLYLCKKIINSHKGQIFASTDGKNTNTFTFVIPRYKFNQTTGTPVVALV